MEESKVFPKMFSWLGIGLLVSFLTGYLLSNDIKEYNMVNIIKPVPK